MPPVDKKPIPFPDLDVLRRFLSSRRSAMNLTYDQLAELSGVSRRAIVAVETGKSPGSMETWLRLSTALEIGFDEIFSVVTGKVTTVRDDFLNPVSPKSASKEDSARA
ncbi:hypothetical protein GCM10027022_03510 [Alpinimonas psychrophila]|uniref:DNA-binding XRE family transcriptional regulator n=1 Tax=Alpinimonas psychrophila TaxID=748908 RepID=A0A7W3JRZ9_9MICO|nr:DNA-binding XRE family transcriptional regulator [Alpinimonas psychrophila]